METVGEARLWLKEKIKNLFSAEELPEIMFLTFHFITGLSKTQQLVFPEKELSEQQFQMLLLSAQKLETGMPIQYVLAEADFFGLKFEVNPSVLIPRPETEELVSWVLEEKKVWSDVERSKEPGSIENQHIIKILDIGTGSGCIPISIKKNWPEATVSGLDISAEALQTAQKNALRNQVELTFFQQDILNFHPVKEASKYTIMVSNPPYILPSERQQMQSNVLDFEPAQALFVPENDPLLFYRAIANFAAVNLGHNGLLFFEINEKFGLEIVELLKQKDFVEVELRQDFRGKDRMVRGVKV